MKPEDELTPERLYAEFLARREAGDDDDVDSVSSSHANLRAELEGLHREQERLDALLADVLSPGGASPTRLHRTPAALTARDLAAADPLLVEGLDIGGYVLVRPIGAGGMGLVWEARQTSLKRNVALKFIRPDHANEAGILRFHTEALAGGRLNHPGIVSVIDTGVHAGRHWIAQELVEGGCTLRDVVLDMRKLERLPDDYERSLAQLFVAIAEALQVAHDAGVIHRDVKPQNILLTRDDRPKVGDFGLARVLGERSATGLGLEGSLPYMSPEQAAAKSIGIDARSDIFSLGAVFYELLTLKRAFGGDSEVQVLEHILHDEPVDPRRLRPSVPRDLAVIAMGALEKRRTDRYQSMREFAADLRRHLADEPILWQPPGLWERTSKWVRRHPTRSVASILGALLITALATLGPALLDKIDEARESSKHAFFVEALAAIEHGNIEQASERVARALEVDPRDPRGHIYLAAGHVQYSQFREAQAQVQAALDKGFPTEAPGPDATARAHHAYAMYLIVTRKSRAYAEAEQHLVRALELEPGLEGALYPLYQLRKERDDTDGARTSLLAYSQKLELQDEFLTVVQALLAELDGKYEQALEILEPLGALPEAQRLALRHPLLVGRNRLLLNDLDGAEASLLEQVRAVPENGVAWEYLAQIHLLRVKRSPQSTRAREELRRAGEAAERASAWDAGRARPYHLRIEVELVGLQHRPDRSAPIPAQDLTRARERLDELRALDPQDELLPAYESDLLFEQALSAGDPVAAVTLLERSVETYADSLVARVLLAQSRWEAGDYAASLELLEHAIAIWPQGHWECKWLFAAHVWAFGSADRAGLVERAWQARDAAEELLAAGECGFHPDETLTLAEFLSAAQGELRDCVRARDLIAEHDLERHYQGLNHSQGLSALRAIEAACP